MENRLGRWEVLGELARGGQGAVVRARHADTGQAAAIKLLLRPDPRALRRFRQEAAVLARLSHPNLVRVLDHGERDGAPWLAMELVEGQSLAALLRERGPPAWDWTARALAAVAGALQHCHERGVVHRDLKPENVIVERGTERPVLVDFGLVRRDSEVFGELSIDAHSRLSRTGELRGTPAYMAPEQVSPGKWGQVGPWTDVYALGATLHVMLTGEPPHRAESLPGLIYAILEQPPADPRALDPAVPAPLARLCLAAMARPRAERPPSAEAFAAALLEAGAPGAARGARGRALPGRGGLAGLVGLAALLAVIVALATRWTPVYRGSPPAPPAPVTAPAPTSGAPAPAPPAQPAAPTLPRAAAPIARSPRGLLRLLRVHGAHEARHPDHVWSIAVSSDERRVVSGTGFWNHRKPATLQVRELGAPEELRAWRAHASSITGVAFTADGRRVVSGGRDGAVLLWDAERPGGPPLAACPRDDGVVSLEPLPGRADTWLVARARGALSLVRAAGGALQEEHVARLRGTVSRAVPLPDGARAIVDGGPGAESPLSVLDLATGALRPLHGRALNAATLALSPDGRRLLAPSHDQTVYLFDLAGGAPRSFFVEGRAKVWGAAWLPDSRRVLVSRFDGRLAILDADSGAELRVLELGHSLWGSPAVTLLRDGRRALAAAGDGRLVLYDLDAERDLTASTSADAFPAPVRRVALSGDGRRALVACFEARGAGTVHVLDLRTGARRVLRTERDWAGAVGFVGPTQAVVACAAPDPRVQRWDLAAGTHVDVPADFGDEQLTAGAVSPDGRWLLAGGNDGHARAWRLDADGPPRALDLEPMPSTTASDAAFSPDGDGALGVLLRARHGGEALTLLSRWDLDRGEQGTAPVPYQATAVAVLPGGRDVLVGGAGGELRRHRLYDGEETRAYPDHATHVLDVALSPDGARVVSSDLDGLVRVCDAASGDVLDALDLGLTGDRAECLAFTPDGARLIIGTSRALVLDVALGRED